ncbi:MAG: hypothetical protein K2L87_06790, partial [Clostridiales bacterium]|nr:hypothetical protein [Clostridiales bacterium]
LIALYRRVRPGEVPTEDSVRQQLNNLFFDPRRYDVVKVGRYKFNKKLNLAYRLAGCRVADDIFHPETGELLATKGEVVSEAKAREIQNAGIGELFVLVNDPEGGEIRHKMISNNTVDFAALSDKNPKAFGLLKTVYYPNFAFSKKIAAECETLPEEEVAQKYLDEINAIYYVRETAPEADEKQEEKKNREKRKDAREKFVRACKLFHALLARDDEKLASDAPISLEDTKRVMGITPDEKKTIQPLVDKLNHKCITVDDIVAAVSTNLDLQYGIGSIDEIDHLGNRRVRSVGELLQNQLRIGMARLERLIKERMATADPMEVTPSSLINVRPIPAVIREFFGSSQLSQFMDQTNP